MRDYDHRKEIHLNLIKYFDMDSKQYGSVAEDILHEINEFNKQDNISVFNNQIWNIPDRFQAERLQNWFQLFYFEREYERVQQKHHESNKQYDRVGNKINDKEIYQFNHEILLSKEFDINILCQNYHPPIHEKLYDLHLWPHEGTHKVKESSRILQCRAKECKSNEIIDQIESKGDS